MGIVILDGEVDEKMVEKTANAVSQGCVDFYLNTPGGIAQLAVVISDMLVKAGPEISLTACNKICSAGFLLFFLTPVRRNILRFTHGMFHGGTMCIDLNMHGNPSYHTGVYLKSKQIPIHRDFDRKFIHELGFTDLEKRNHLRDKDIYFPETRLREFLKIAEKKKLSFESF